MVNKSSLHQMPRLVQSMLVVFCIGFLAWVPLFLASNRPILWALNGAALSAIAFLVLLFNGPSQERSWGTRILAWCFTGLLAWMSVSIVIGLIRPFEVQPGMDLLATLKGVAPLASLSPSDSLYALLAVTGFGLYWWICRAVFSSMPAQIALVLIASIIGFQAMLGLLEFLVDWRFPVIEYFGDGYEKVATAGFVNRNSFATYLGLGAVVCLGLVLSNIQRATIVGDRSGVVPSILVGLTLLVLTFTVLTLTQSRAGLVSTAIALFSVIVFFAFAYRAFVISLLFLVIFAFGVGIASYVSIEILERFQSSSVSIDVRFEIYRQAAALWLERPLSGYGAGSFETIFGAVKNPRLPSERLWTKAHNTYLAVLVEFGALGSIVMFGLFVVLGLQQIRALFLNKRIAGLIGLGCLVLVALHSLLDFSLEIYAVTATLVAILTIGSQDALRPAVRTEPSVRSHGRSSSHDGKPVLAQVVSRRYTPPIAVGARDPKRGR